MAFNTIQDGPFCGCSRMGVQNSPSLKTVTYIYPTMIKLGTLTLYLTKIKKIYKSCDKLFEYCWHQHFNIQFLILFFFWVFKVCFNKGLAILMISPTLLLQSFMWPKICNSSISMSEVIITSILYGFNPKNNLFWRVA